MIRSLKMQISFRIKKTMFGKLYAVIEEICL